MRKVGKASLSVRLPRQTCTLRLEFGWPGVAKKISSPSTATAAWGDCVVFARAISTNGVSAEPSVAVHSPIVFDQNTWLPLMLHQPAPVLLATSVDVAAVAARA